MALFDGYFGGAKKRQEQILKKTGISGDAKPSIRAAQPKVKKKTKAEKLADWYKEQGIIPPKTQQ